MNVRATEHVAHLIQLGDQRNEPTHDAQRGLRHREHPDRRPVDGGEHLGQRLALGPRLMARRVPHPSPGVRPVRDRRQRTRDVQYVGPGVRQVGVADHPGGATLDRRGQVPGDVAVAAHAGAQVVRRPDLHRPDPAGRVPGLGLGPHAGADPAQRVGGPVRVTLSHRGVDGTVAVERGGGDQRRSGPLRGGEQAGGQRWPDPRPVGVVRRVRTVEQRPRSLGPPGQGVGVGGIDADLLHPGHVRHGGPIASPR